MTTMTTAAIVTDADRETFAAFYADVAQRIHLTARRLAPLDAAEDVEQNTWLALLDNWPHVGALWREAPTHARSYALATVHSRATDYLRMRAYRRATSLSQWSNASSAREGDDGVTPLERLVAQGAQTIDGLTPERIVVAQEEWRALLATCASRKHALILAAYAARYTAQEIADLVAAVGEGTLTRSAVKMIVSRLRARALAATQADSEQVGEE